MGVEGSRSVDYEATRYAMAADPASAKQRASEVPVDISREDSKIVIETDGGENTGADYTLRVPTGGSVEVESEVGDVEVSGISGNVTVSAEAGDVRVTDVGGDVEVQTPRGDISVSDVKTDTGSANLEAGVGDVSLEDLILGTLEASVEAGDVILSGRFSGGGRITVQTGDIVARLPPDDARDLRSRRASAASCASPRRSSNGQGSDRRAARVVVSRRSDVGYGGESPEDFWARCEGSGSILSRFFRRLGPRGGALRPPSSPP